MFEKIYGIYEKELTALAFACRAGWAACCTQSVTMTSAEGRAILAFLAEERCTVITGQVFAHIGG